MIGKQESQSQDITIYVGDRVRGRKVVCVCMLVHSEFGVTT